MFNHKKNKLFLYFLPGNSKKLLAFEGKSREPFWFVRPKATLDQNLSTTNDERDQHSWCHYPGGRQPEVDA